MPLRTAATVTKSAPQPKSTKPRSKVGHSILLIGPPNGGKTYTAAGNLTLPEYLPWKMWNCDRPDGAAAIHVPQGCKVVDLSSTLMETPQGLADQLDAELNTVGPLPYKTYILDSISFFHNYAIVASKVISAGSFQKVGRAGWGDIYLSTTEVVLKLRALQGRGANIIVTCHEAEKDDPLQGGGLDPSQKQSIIVPALSGKSGQQLVANFGLVGYITCLPSYDSKKRADHVMYTDATGRFTARCSYGHVVDPVTKQPIIPVEWKNPKMDDVLTALDKARDIANEN